MKNTANLIKISAVITAIPRWVIALLAAEGLTLPPAWRGWWVVFSALAAVGMAIVEGVAFAYVFSAWRSCRQASQSRVLIGLAGLSAALFCALLTPSIAANVRGLTLGAWVSSDALLTAWAGVVSGSTISIVASIGYAEKARISEPAKAQDERIVITAPALRPDASAMPSIAPQDAPALPAATAPVMRQCPLCSEQFDSAGKLAAHVRWQHSKKNGAAVSAKQEAGA
jgi:hypothetical protein